MGGFAVVIDWEHPVDARAVNPMMALVPHRTTGGVRVHAAPHAVLAEGRTATRVEDPWEIATLGPLSIVGDIRLFDTARLRALAGGGTATAGLDDRRLLLAAFRRRGMAALDAIDGDYAFVMWDDERRRVLAVRDRFAVMPIFFEETPTGIRFGSEVKQLAATSLRTAEPDTESLVEYITYDFSDTRRTFFTGVERIRASDVLEGTQAGITHRRYWDPEPSGERHQPSDLPGLFREHLTESVRRRLATSTAVVSQLSGGLDSPAIAAAAATLHRDGHPVDLTTVSAVYDHPSIDESHWIADIVAMQPFPHRDFTPAVGDISLFDDDIWAIDGPLTDPIRDMNERTAAIAAEVGAGLAFTGNFGDHLGYQARYLADLLRSGRPVRFARDVTRSARWTGRSVLATVTPPLRQLAPAPVRSLARRLRPNQPPGLEWTLVGRTPPQPTSDPRRGFPSHTQAAIAADIREPLFTRINEMQSAIFATHGIELTHPFMDRNLVEFVVSIHPLDLPFDGRSKTLVRQAFAHDLPPSVLERRTATTADRYIADALTPHHDAYRDRYRTLPANATMIDPLAYRQATERYDRGTITTQDLMALRRVWQALSFTDGAIRYRGIPC
jgi:asparagine synthase (glutamine-hydrolysing)